MNPFEKDTWYHNEDDQPSCYMIVSEDVIELMYHTGVCYVAANQPSQAKTWLEKASEHQLQRDPVLTSRVGQQLITVFRVLCFLAHS